MRSLPLPLLLFLPVYAAGSLLCPQRCQCYEDPTDPTGSVHLICKWNDLNSSPLSSFARPESVRTLTIRCPHHTKKKSRPPAGLFNGLKNLDRLEIDRCPIEAVPVALFAGLHQLYSLIIKRAELVDLPKEVFAYVPNLMTLDLSGNKLNIEPYALRSLTNLIQLDLSNNAINFLANTLATLPKLQVLAIDHNALTNIDTRRLPPDLLDLSIRHNLVNTIHYIQGSAKRLRRLDLSHNQLDFISGTGSVNVLPTSLKHVDISSNRVSFVQDGAVRHMTDLIMIDLRNNNLAEIRSTALSIGPSLPEEGKGETRRLKTALAGNPLICQCSIEWLVEAHNQTLPQVVDGGDVKCRHWLDSEREQRVQQASRDNHMLCKYMQYCPASCSCCGKDECACEWRCPTGCECMRSSRDDQKSEHVMSCDSVRFDKMTDLPESLTELRLVKADWAYGFPLHQLAKLPRLHTLNVTQTKLDRVDATWLDQLPSLRTLDVSDNKIQSIPEGMEQLKQLKMAGNPIKKFTSSSGDALAAIRRVWLASPNSTDDALQCDCDRPSELQIWLRTPRNREKVADLDRVLCELSMFGLVRVMDTLPGNATVCEEETTETTEWMQFVENVKESTRDSTEWTSTEVFTSTSRKWSPSPSPSSPSSTSTKPNPRPTQHVDRDDIFSVILPTDSQEDSFHPMEANEDRMDMETTTTTTTEGTTTTRALRRKYMREEPESHKFINALIFVLFCSIVALVIAIAAMIYSRFSRTDVTVSPKRPPPEEEALRAQ